MKLTLSWLKQFIDTNASLEEICDKLTELGVEVEQVVDHSTALAPFTIAQIIEATPHPNADKLRVCKVDTGKEILNIVCGASNARTGIKVVLAPEGTIIPSNNLVIRRSKIRDVESCGMLCSAEELGLSGASEGIIELDENAPIGTRFIDYCTTLTDPLIEVSITPNRGDCLSIYGLARELIASGTASSNAKPPREIITSLQHNIAVKVTNEQDCPLYVTRVFSGVKNQESPQWLQERLSSIGQNSISTLVDISNYICHSYGTPMHIFDAKKIKGTVQVRNAIAGEKFIALNEKEYELQGGELVIADDAKILALAGIIGGLDSACDLDTTEILIEVAIFKPSTISKTGRYFAIETESRHRFERGVDQNFVTTSMQYASALIDELCGGKASEVVTIGKSNITSKTLSLEFSRLEKLSGLKLDHQLIIKILESLGFIVKADQHSLHLIIPSWRHDINIAQDIVEEVLRLYGYNNIPTLSLPVTGISDPVLTVAQQSLLQLKRAMATNGLNEVISWSFTASTQASHFNLYDANLALANPISADLDVMRQSIIPNLLAIAEKNHHRSEQNQALFELGPVFSYKDSYRQETALSILRCGNNNERNIYQDTRAIDTFDVKQDLLLALEVLGIEMKSISLLSENIPEFLHPGRSAVIKYRNNIIGFLGQIHPKICNLYDLSPNIVVLELKIDALAIKYPIRETTRISNFQLVERDFAFVVTDQVTAESLVKTIASADKNFIGKVKVFDQYINPETMPGYKSLAVNVQIQPTNKTLTSEEINNISDTIISIVEKKLGGRLRQE